MGCFIVFASRGGRNLYVERGDDRRRYRGEYAHADQQRQEPQIPRPAGLFHHSHAGLPVLVEQHEFSFAAGATLRKALFTRRDGYEHNVVGAASDRDLHRVCRTALRAHIGHFLFFDPFEITSVNHVGGQTG